MDRGLIYPGQVPLESDLLFAQRAGMVGLSKLAAAMLGTGTVVNGLAVTQTTVASMSVQVAAGEIYQLANLDATAYSSLAADTTHQILKQGVNLDATLLTLTAPGTTGFSVNYLIQATLTEADNTPVVLPYYNASNPATAYSGPAGAGTTQNTRRTAVVTLSAKAGTAATTGTQTTPSPDAGYVGLAVVTVANGAVTVVNANISAYASAPTLPYNLATLANGFGASFGANSYLKLPSGGLAQFGSGTTSAGTGTVTFPFTFPNACRAVLAVESAASAWTATNLTVYGTTTKSPTGVTVKSFTWGGASFAAGGGNFDYIAFGN